MIPSRYILSCRLAVTGTDVTSLSCAQAVLLEAIDDAGFEGELLQEADSNAITLRVEGMTCSSCSSAVETALRNQKGVMSAAVNLLAKRAEVQYRDACL